MANSTSPPQPLQIVTELQPSDHIIFVLTPDESGCKKTWRGYVRRAGKEIGELTDVPQDLLGAHNGILERFIAGLTGQQNLSAQQSTSYPHIFHVKEIGEKQ